MKLSRGTNALSKLPLINWFEEVTEDKADYRAYMKSVPHPAVELSAKPFQDRLQSYGPGLMYYVTGLLKYTLKYITKKYYQHTVIYTKRWQYPPHSLLRPQERKRTKRAGVEIESTSKGTQQKLSFALCVGK